MVWRGLLPPCRDGRHGAEKKGADKQGSSQSWPSWEWTFITYLGFISLSETVLVAQLYLTLCDPKDSSVHGILQARTLEWVAISFTRGSSWSRDRTQISCTVGRFFIIWASSQKDGQSSTIQSLEWGWGSGFKVAPSYGRQVGAGGWWVVSSPPYEGLSTGCLSILQTWQLISPRAGNPGGRELGMWFCMSLGRHKPSFHHWGQPTFKWRESDFSFCTESVKEFHTESVKEFFVLVTPCSMRES